MNLKVLFLRLKKQGVVDVYHYPSDQTIHLKFPGDTSWYQFNENGTLFTISRYKDQDFVKQRNPEFIYRADGWYWDAVVASLGLPVQAEAAKLAG